MSIAANAPPSAPQEMHWTTKIGVAAVILFMLVVAGLNAVGWMNTLPGAGGIAASVVAVSFEAMALVAFEHLVAYKKARDYGRLFLAFVGLALAVSVNIEGGHRGLNHIAEPFFAQAESERRANQEALDAARSGLEQQIATLQARVDGVAATNPGAETFSERMEQWRANFELVTGEDRRQITLLRARLADMPLTVNAQAPYPDWAPYAIAAIFAFFSVFGLTMFSVKVPGPELHVGNRNATAALEFSKAMLIQDIAASEKTEAPALIEKAEELPPLDDVQIRQAIAALTLQEKEVTPANVARFHKVKVARVYASPHVVLLHEYIAQERQKKALRAAANAIAGDQEQQAA